MKIYEDILWKDLAQAVRVKAAILNLTNKEVAKQIGTHPTTLSRMHVHNTPVNATTFMRICYWLNTDPYDYFKGAQK